MLRRNFLKGAVGLWSGFATYFSYKYFSDGKSDRSLKNIQKNANNKTFYHVEIPVCYHCNINCAGCDHFAPLAKKYQIPVEVFEKDIKRLAYLAQESIQEIMLLGGEPLLHNKIDELIKIARDNFPDARLIILTNGLLLDKINEEFYETCAKNKVKITISNYIEYKKPIDFNYINSMSKKYGTAFEVTVPRRNFDLINLTHKNSKSNIAKKYIACKHKINGALLDNGVLYSCCIAKGIKKFFNTTFEEKAIPFESGDTLDIYKISSLGEITAFLNKPKSICAYCNYCNKSITNKRHWKLSKKELEEWYKV